jgi:secretion/DNA translocation related TadE-like protein
MVTAEFAMALPAVVIVLAALLATVAVALDQIRCTDAARAAVRAAARNEPAAAVVAAAQAVGPEGARVNLRRDGDRVAVTVSADVAVRLLGDHTLRVSARAVAAREEDGDPGAGVVIPPPLLPRRRVRTGVPHGSDGSPRGGPPGRGRPAGRRTRRCGRDDAGSGTVLVVGLVAVAAALTLGLSLLGQVIVARHRAAAAADLAALAAAGAAHAPPSAPATDPCAVAADVAIANGATLTSCRLDQAGVAAVSVQTVAKTAAHVFRPTAEARAGPAATSDGDHQLRKVVHVTH